MDKKSVSFKVDHKLWSDLKILSINKNIKLSDMLENMVIEYVERENK